MRESEERVMASLAHASILLNLIFAAVGGPIACAVIWAVYRERSRQIAFHALQALIYQVGIQLIALPLGACLVLAGISIGAALDNTALGVWEELGPVLGLGVPACLWAAYFLAVFAYGVVGAFRTYNGVEFEYLLIGRWLRPK